MLAVESLNGVGTVSSASPSQQPGAPRCPRGAPPIEVRSSELRISSAPPALGPWSHADESRPSRVPFWSERIRRWSLSLKSTAERACMAKRSEIVSLGGLWLEGHGRSVGSEVLGRSSRVRRAAPSLQMQPDEPVEASHGLAKTATLTIMLARRREREVLDGRHPLLDVGVDCLARVDDREHLLLEIMRGEGGYEHVAGRAREGRGRSTWRVVWGRGMSTWRVSREGGV